MNIENQNEMDEQTNKFSIYLEKAINFNKDSILLKQSNYTVEQLNTFVTYRAYKDGTYGYVIANEIQDNKDVTDFLQDCVATALKNLTKEEQ